MVRPFQLARHMGRTMRRSTDDAAMTMIAYSVLCEILPKRCHCIPRTCRDLQAAMLVHPDMVLDY